MSNISKEKLQKLQDLAKFLAVMGVRNNTELEDLHAGTSPTSIVGDYSGVKIITPKKEIQWNKLSRFDDEEMRSLMLSIEHALENALMAYEKADQKMKKDLLEFAKTQRSYDCDDSWLSN